MTSDQSDYHHNRLSLAGKVEKFEGKNAVIIIEDGQRLLWPIKNLPADVEVNSEVRLILSTAKTDQAERAYLAKTILNEILKGAKSSNGKSK